VEEIRTTSPAAVPTLSKLTTRKQSAREFKTKEEFEVSWRNGVVKEDLTNGHIG